MSDEEGSTLIEDEEVSPKPLKTIEEKKSKYLFYMKIKEGHIIKVLVEYIKTIVKETCLCITKRGILIKAMNGINVLFQIRLYGESMSKYQVEKDMTVGLSTKYLLDNIKNIKKKDVLSLCIDEKSPNLFKSETNPGDKSNGVQGASTKIIRVPLENIEESDNYDDEKTITIPAKALTKVLKNTNKKESKHISFTRRNDKIIFISSGGGDEMSAKYGEFGHEDDEEYDRNHPIDFQQNYDTASLSAMVKLMSLSETISVSFGKDTKTDEPNPIRFSFRIQAIGKVIIYMGSREMIQKQEENKEGQEEEEEEEPKKVRKTRSKKVKDLAEDDD